MDLVKTYINVQGLRIHTLSAGLSGSPVLLLHGGGTDSAHLSWGLTLEALAEEHRVFALNWPGYGESDRPDIEYTQDFYLDFLCDFVQALGIERAAVAGISMGGGIALGYALRWPQIVSKLVLVDSYGLHPTAPYHRLSYLFIRMPLLNEMTWAALGRSQWMARLSLQNIFSDPSALPEDLVDLVWEEVRKPGAGRAFRSFQKNDVLWSGLRTRYAERLGELKMPTLIIHGEKDRLVPLEAARKAHQAIPDSQLAVIPAAGHWPQREKPQEFNRILAGFLKDG